MIDACVIYENKCGPPVGLFFNEAHAPSSV